MTKQETIAKAYGEHWKKVKDFVDENGWFDMKFYDEGNFEDEFFDNCDVKNAFIKPKSLAGIETNNGWIKIESESDLPRESGFYFGKDYEFGTDIMYFDFETKKWKDLSGYLQQVTHYQPIVKPEPPIY